MILLAVLANNLQQTIDERPYLVFIYIKTISSRMLTWYVYIILKASFVFRRHMANASQKNLVQGFYEE